MLAGMFSNKNSVVASSIALRAQVTWMRIQDKAVEISLKRRGVWLDPQILRIELDNFVTSNEDESGYGYARKGILFGIHGHPELDDSDIQTMDSFVMDNCEYTVMSVNRHLVGEIQATFEMVG